MEPSCAAAVDSPTPHAPVGLRRRVRAGAALVPGLALALVIAWPAVLLGDMAPMVGGPVLGIAVGAVVGPLLRRFLSPVLAGRLRPGAAAAGRHLLQASIVVLGTGLPLGEVVHVGIGSLPVMLGTVLVAVSGAWLIGRLLGIHAESRLLIGVGTGICGASAIAAVTAVIDAAEARVAYALGTIFTFNIAAVLLFPPLGHLLGLSQQGFGLWSGTAINDTSSVVAAAYSYGSTAGSFAVVVKLTRSLLIVPICVALRAWQGRQRRAEQETQSKALGSAWRAFPLFIVGFLAASALATSGVVPHSWHASLSATGTVLVTAALTGMGLSLEWSRVRDAGLRPLLLGAILWGAVAATALGLQALTGRL